MSKPEVVEWGDEPAIEAHLGGETDEPVETSDVYKSLAAECAAIMSDFAKRFASSPKSAKRAIKEARGAAMAAAKRKWKDAAKGRRKLAKDRKLRRPDRVRKSPSSAAVP